MVRFSEGFRSDKRAGACAALSLCRLSDEDTLLVSRAYFANNDSATAISAFVPLLVSAYNPQSQYAKYHRNNSEKRPETGKTLCVCGLHRVSDTTERVEPRDGDPKTYDREYRSHDDC